MAPRRAAALVLAALVSSTEGKGLLRQDATLDAADSPNTPTCFACPGETRLAHHPPASPTAQATHAHAALVASKAAVAATASPPPASPPHLALGDPRRPQPPAGSDTLGASEPFVVPTMRKKREAELKARMFKAQRMLARATHAVRLDAEEGSGDPENVVKAAKQQLISSSPALCVGCPDRCHLRTTGRALPCLPLLRLPHV